MATPQSRLRSTAPLKGEPRAETENRRADLYFFRNEPCRNRRNRLPNLRHSEEGEARRGNPFSLAPELVFSLSQGDADCHSQCEHWLRNDRWVFVLCAVFGNAKIPRPAGRCPFYGKSPVRTLGKGVSGVGCGAGGKRQDAVQTILFPIGSPSAMATPQSRLRSTAPLRGEPRAETEAAALIYTSSAMNHAEIGATAYPTSVIPRRAKPDVGIRSPLRRTKTTHIPKGMRIATSLRSSQ